MRLNLLKYPLVLKKNESIRGQEKGQYKNNGLLFPPQDLAPSGPTNLSPNRPSIYLQSIYCLLNQLLPPAPMSFLHISPWLAVLSTLPRDFSSPSISQRLLCKWLDAFQPCSSSTDCSDTTGVWMTTLWSHLFMVEGVVGGLFTCEKHQMTRLKLNLFFSTKCSLSTLPWSANNNLTFSVT